MIKHVNTIEEFNEEIKGTVLVDFFATWCGPCRMLSPVIEEADKNNELGIDVIKVDVDEVPDAARKFGVQSIPTLIVFKDGKIAKATMGYMNKPQLVDFVKKSIE